MGPLPDNGAPSSAWWQLLRAGNVFTAISNILAGFLLVRGEWQPVLPLVFLIISSAALYLSGMVLNDVFDLETDRAQRPERPLPSGRINPQMAKLVGWGLMFDGLSAAGVAAWLLASWLPILVAASLAVAILAYDIVLKKTMFGPLAMGACRALNVLLGASVIVHSADKNAAYLYALLLGAYTVGITLLARNEAGSAKIQQWVSRLITMFIPLDALACATAAGWPAALIVLSLLIPTYIATRRVPMT